MKGMQEHPVLRGRLTMRVKFRACIIFFFVSFFLVPGLFAERTFNLAVVRHQDFQPFEKAYEGFMSGLTVWGYRDRIKIVEDFNAKSNIRDLEAHIQSYRNRSDIDLIFSIGTHSTKRLAKTVTHIPMVYTIVGDPERAGIVSDWKSSGKNYTGVETPEYYSKVVRLMHNYIPFKSLGMIYLEGSPSHEAGIDQIVVLAKELGFTFIRKGFPLRNAKKVPYPKAVTRKNIADALEAVCPHVEAFFVQTSNAFTRNFDLFETAFLKHRLISAGDPTNIERGLVMGVGKDAYHFGEQCAQYAIQILEGAAPASLPMDVGGKLTIDVNLKAAERIGFKPPFELLSAADNLYQRLAATKQDQQQ
jgi:ABC-type uncharacterized transport system substrate-binding protein